MPQLERVRFVLMRLQNAIMIPELVAGKKKHLFN